MPLQNPAWQRRRPLLFGSPHAADTLFDSQEMAEAREQLPVEHGSAKMYVILVDRFEIRVGEGEENYLWDLDDWYGGDINRLWSRAKARAISATARTVPHDVSLDPKRLHPVVGLYGLMPYVFEIDAAAYLTDKGDLTGRLDSAYDLQINQRLILQPRVELNVAAKELAELRIGSGVGSIEAGARLRNQVWPEFAPYILWLGTKARRQGRPRSRSADVDRGRREASVGTRLWF